MSRAITSRKAGRSKRTQRRLVQAHLDWLALETLRLTASTFSRCGYASSQLVAGFRRFLDNPQRPPEPPRTASKLNLHDPGHVLTLWASDPHYVDETGMPRPITLRGQAPSLEALVKRVTPPLNLQEAVHRLESTGAIRKIGRRYIPTGEFVYHQARGESQSTHHLIVLYQLLRNFDFNANLAPGVESWPQRVVECPDFPVSELPALIVELKRRITAFTDVEDRLLSRVAKSAPATAARARAVVNLFLSIVDAAGAQVRQPPSDERRKIKARSRP